MKASVLIKKLEEQINIAGDWDVVIDTPDEYYDIKGVFVLDQNEIGIDAE